jgi:branched-chain amino acid transport system substrate-binding protein
MKSFIRVLFIVSLALPWIAGCGKRENTAANSAAGEETVIGSLLPLTGDGAAYGVEIKNGIDLAVEQANAAGGVNGRKIRVVYEDTKGDPTTAVSAFQSVLARYRVPAVIGAAFSGETLAIVPIATREKVVVLSPTASSPKLSGSSPYFFRVWPSDNAEASVMAEFAVNKLGKKRLAVIYSNSDYGVGLRNAFVAKARQLGADIVQQEAFNEKDTDFRAQLQNIKAQNPDAVYMTGYYQEFAQILKQAKELGIAAQFLSCGTFHEPQVISLAGGAAQGVIFTQPYYDPESKDVLVQKFVQQFKAKFGITPGLYAAHGYDAARVLIRVLQTAKSLDGQSIRETISSIKDFPGITGVTTFVAGGDVVKPYRIMTVRKGTFSAVEGF